MFNKNNSIQTMLMASVFVLGISLSDSLLASIFMNAKWAEQACNQWNQTAILTKDLAGLTEPNKGYSWINNDEGRGYKLISLYREHCKESSKIQLMIQNKKGKALCVYGGKAYKTSNYRVDYLMYATDTDWNCMGKGMWGCGPMGAIASGRLKFKGPKMEAMKVMRPFASFLRLTGTIAGDKTVCPK